MSQQRDLGGDLARVRVDRPACTAHGVCASLLPDSIELDEWGYPIVVDPVVDGWDGQTAVTMCPSRALFLEPVRRR